jgi:hypothetical protein
MKNGISMIRLCKIATLLLQQTPSLPGLDEASCPVAEAHNANK